MSEKEVFVQDVSDEEMEAVAGGHQGNLNDHYPTTCTTENLRYIYEGGFPNCAASVEAGSWCGSNDACYDCDVVYLDMAECKLSWH